MARSRAPKKPPKHGSEHYDVAVVGGGPAGLSAAIWLARYLHSVVVIDSGDPRNWETLSINGYLGLPGVCPADLRGGGRQTCRELGVTLRDGLVLRTDHGDDDRFIVCVEGGGRLTADRLLLAIGLRDVWPDIPGLEHVYGANAHVCPDCDGFDARGKRVAVIGTGRKAVTMALNLTTWTRDIVICTNGRPADVDAPEYCDKLDAHDIRILTDPIAGIGYRGHTVECLELANGSRLDVDKLFFAIAQYPADDLGAQLGCTRDRGGHIVVDERLHTSAHNVFAAGDIVPGPQLAVVAAAQGAVAAVSIHKSLVRDDQKLMPRRRRSARRRISAASSP
jgi:thioredoxin reductase